MLAGDINDDSYLQSGGFSIPGGLDETYTLYICIAFGILIFFAYIVYTKIIVQNPDDAQCSSCNIMPCSMKGGLF
jgi:hypothetical protein